MALSLATSGADTPPVASPAGAGSRPPDVSRRVVTKAADTTIAMTATTQPLRALITEPPPTSPRPWRARFPDPLVMLAAVSIDA